MGVVNRLDENKLAAELETIALLAERIEFGAGKYGPLHIDSSRDWVKETREETLDASVYLTWKIMQHESAQRKMGGE
jgi:hypothetical protein